MAVKKVVKEEKVKKETPVATKKSGCEDHVPRYKGDFMADIKENDENGDPQTVGLVRTQIYVCDTCREETHVEAPDA